MKYGRSRLAQSCRYIHASLLQEKKMPCDVVRSHDDVLIKLVLSSANCIKRFITLYLHFITLNASFFLPCTQGKPTSTDPISLYFFNNNSINKLPTSLIATQSVLVLSLIFFLLFGAVLLGVQTHTHTI